MQSISFSLTEPLEQDKGAALQPACKMWLSHIQVWPGLGWCCSQVLRSFKSVTEGSQGGAHGGKDVVVQQGCEQSMQVSVVMP